MPRLSLVLPVAETSGQGKASGAQHQMGGDHSERVREREMETRLGFEASAEFTRRGGRMEKREGEGEFETRKIARGRQGREGK